MENHDDILAGYQSTGEPEQPSVIEAETDLEEKRDKLQRAKKKLKKAKKKGKGAKKLKKKVKKLKAKVKSLEEKLRNSKALISIPYRGRWDVLIERSVPEAIKLVNTVVKQRSPQSHQEVVHICNKNRSKYPLYNHYGYPLEMHPIHLPHIPPAYLPNHQPLYLPSSPESKK